MLLLLLLVCVLTDVQVCHRDKAVRKSKFMPLHSTLVDQLTVHVTSTAGKRDVILKFTKLSWNMSSDSSTIKNNVHCTANLYRLHGRQSDFTINTSSTGYCRCKFLNSAKESACCQSAKLTDTVNNNDIVSRLCIITNTVNLCS